MGLALLDATLEHDERVLPSVLSAGLCDGLPHSTRKPSIGAESLGKGLDTPRVDNKAWSFRTYNFPASS